LRARARRRQQIRRLEIIAVVIVIATIASVGIYLAMSPQGGKDSYVSKQVSQSIYSAMGQASLSSFSVSGSAYMTAVHNVGGQVLSADGKPILVSATGEHCAPCALQRWPLVLALVRFGNFTNLEYMTSSAAEGDYATFAFAESSYQSDYLVFQPYEVFDRSGTPFQALPANYSLADQQYGSSSIPFLDFAGQYVISGGILPDPSILGAKNWTQIISSINTGDTLGTQIKQATNVITAVICKTTGEKPDSVCNQGSIPELTTSLVSYLPQPTTLPVALMPEATNAVRGESQVNVDASRERSLP
jgi:hypothetical protein